MALNLPILAALAAQLLPAPGAVQWELVAEEREGRTSIDPASLARDGDVVTFLLRLDAAAPTAEGFRVQIVRLAVDCRRRALGIRSADAYGEDGRFANSVEAPEVEFVPLGTSPGHERLVQRVCPAAAR